MQKTLLATILASTAISGFAVTKNYDIDEAGSSINGYTTANSINGLGLVLTKVLSLPDTTFSLNDGGVKVVDFFTISTYEGSHQADDATPQPISATLLFSDPSGASAAFTGLTFSGMLFPVIGNAEAQLVWDNTLFPINVPGDRSFSVELNNLNFGKGTHLFGDLSQGAKTVKATITQISSGIAPEGTAVVPDGGATATMLGSVLAGIGMASRRFRR